MHFVTYWPGCVAEALRSCSYNTHTIRPQGRRLQPPGSEADGMMDEVHAVPKSLKSLVRPRPMPQYRRDIEDMLSNAEKGSVEAS